MPSPKRLRQRLLSPHILLLLTAAFWAGNAVIARGSVGTMPPLALSFWRWLAALLILLPFGLPRLRSQWPLIRRHLPILTVLAATSVAAYNTMLYLALQTTTAINAMLVASSMPMVIILLSWLWLGEGIGLRQGFGVLVSLAGVLAVIGRGDVRVLAGLELQVGDLWVLAAVMSWSVYSVLLRRHPTGIDPTAMLTVLCIIGTALILPLYLWELAAGQDFVLTWHTAGVIGYLALFPSALAYYFWNQGVAAVGANTAGLYAYVVPVFAAVLAVVFLGEELRWFHAAGLALIFLGIWLARKR